jgi:anti-sigma factor ChrR (cupin superfamily)
MYRPHPTAAAVIIAAALWWWHHCRWRRAVAQERVARLTDQHEHEQEIGDLTALLALADANEIIRAAEAREE